MNTKDIDVLEVGTRIRNIRIEKGLSMEEFGKLFNTSKGTVNNWEKGRNLPNKENLKSIALLNDITVDELLTGKEPLRKIGEQLIIAELKEFKNSIKSSEGYRGLAYVDDDNIIYYLYLRMPKVDFRPNVSHLVDKAVATWHHSSSTVLPEFASKMLKDIDNNEVNEEQKYFFYKIMMDIQDLVLDDYIESIDSDITRAMRLNRYHEAPLENKYWEFKKQKVLKIDLSDEFKLEVLKVTNELTKLLSKKLISLGRVIKVECEKTDEHPEFTSYDDDPWIKTVYYTAEGKVQKVLKK